MDVPVVEIKVQRSGEWSLQDLWAERVYLAKALAAAKAELDQCDREIASRLEERAKAAYLAARKETGTVHVDADGLQFEIDTPKRVKWDQGALSEFCHALAESGGDPYEFIKVEMSIPERVYDAMTPDLQKLAMAARTVEHGKRVIKVKDEK